mmetsp:Transcript_20789/g.30788  ORF Transcript_20789/g.30788 Transcript_20789/m.30788 type:complete len:208 (+) Transcript_20789:303-926(+)
MTRSKFLPTRMYWLPSFGCSSSGISSSDLSACLSSPAECEATKDLRPSSEKSPSRAYFFMPESSISTMRAVGRFSAEMPKNSRMRSSVLSTVTNKYSPLLALATGRSLATLSALELSELSMKARRCCLISPPKIFGAFCWLNGTMSGRRFPETHFLIESLVSSPSHLTSGSSPSKLRKTTTVSASRPALTVVDMPNCASSMVCAAAT